MSDNNFNQEYLPCLKISSKSISDKLRHFTIAQNMSIYFSQFSCCAFSFDDYFFAEESKFDSFEIRNNNIFPSMMEDSAPEKMNNDILVVGGVITKKLVPYIIQMYQQMPVNRWVMAVGACACSGGPFKSYSTLSGISEILPVDVYVPGCPPTSMEVISGIQLLNERISMGVMGQNAPLGNKE